MLTHKSDCDNGQLPLENNELAFFIGKHFEKTIDEILSIVFPPLAEVANDKSYATITQFLTKVVIAVVSW